MPITKGAPSFKYKYSTVKRDDHKTLEVALAILTMFNSHLQ